MFKIDEYEDKFKIYELKDESSGSSVKVCPERGGIIIGFSVDGKEILYLNKKTFYDLNSNIRGGIPILFPLCGKLEGGKYKVGDKEYTMKNHGVARINPWQVVDTCTDEKALIKIKLSSSTDTKKSYPFDFETIFTYTLKGNEIEISQEYMNKSDSLMPMEVGFHPYFNVKDKSKVHYDLNASKYFDYNDLKIKDYGGGEIDISNYKESLMFPDGSEGSVDFEIKDLKRKIRLEYSPEFKYIVLWTESGKDFVCVEPWTAKPGALQTKEGLTYIKPHENLNLKFKISVSNI